MKKSSIFTLAILAAAAPLFSACSDNDNPNVPAEFDKTFSGKQLDLDFSGDDMEGKSVRIQKFGDEATVTLFSQLDLALIPGAGLVDVKEGPGILPGSPSVTLNVDLVQKDGKYTFTGNAETQYCTYKYDGRFNDNELDLEISNVHLKNTTLSNYAFAPKQLVINQTTQTPESSPFTLVWDSSAKVDLGDGNNISMQQILDALQVLPIATDPQTGEKSPLATMLTKYLKAIWFRADSNILAKYVEKEGNGWELETSDANLAHYVVKSPSQLLIFLNPVAIMDEALDNTRALSSSTTVDITLIEAVMAKFAPMLANGIPLAYNLNGADLTISVPAEIISPLVKDVLTPIISDPALLKQLVDKITADPAMSGFAPAIENALKSLPEVLAKTNAINLGINLTKTTW